MMSKVARMVGEPVANLKLVCRVVAISTGESERKGDESEEGDAAIGSQLKRN